MDTCVNRPAEMFIKKKEYVMKPLEFDEQGNFFETVATCYPERRIDTNFIHNLMDDSQRWVFLFKDPTLWSNVDLFWAKNYYGVAITMVTNPPFPVTEMSFLM
jgi:hypothetical protein